MAATSIFTSLASTILRLSWLTESSVRSVPPISTRAAFRGIMRQTLLSSTLARRVSSMTYSTARRRTPSSSRKRLGRNGGLKATASRAGLLLFSSRPSFKCFWCAGFSQTQRELFPCCVKLNDALCCHFHYSLADVLHMNGFSLAVHVAYEHIWRWQKK